MMSLPLVSRAAHGGALVAVLAGVTACAPANQNAQPATVAQSSPVLLSCPAGLQPLLRQTVVNGALVPQVECVTAPAPSVPVAAPVQAPPYAQAPGYAAPAYAPAPAVYTPVAAPAAVPVSYQTPVRRPSARRAVYSADDVVEYKRPRSWKKSAVIIGSAAGIGAGVGGATKGKKGALIGAAIGGGAAALWDQVTRR
jgi:hypothetical protein